MDSNRESNSGGESTNPNTTYATNISKDVEEFISQPEILWIFQVWPYAITKPLPEGPHEGKLSPYTRCGAQQMYCSLWMALQTCSQELRVPWPAMLFWISAFLSQASLFKTFFVWCLSKISSSESLPKPTRWVGGGGAVGRKLWRSSSTLWLNTQYFSTLNPSPLLFP